MVHIGKCICARMRGVLQATSGVMAEVCWSTHARYKHGRYRSLSMWRSVSKPVSVVLQTHADVTAS